MSGSEVVNSDPGEAEGEEGGQPISVWRVPLHPAVSQVGVHGWVLCCLRTDFPVFGCSVVQSQQEAVLGKLRGCTAVIFGWHLNHHLSQFCHRGGCLAFKRPSPPSVKHG